MINVETLLQAYTFVTGALKSTPVRMNDYGSPVTVIANSLLGSSCGYPEGQKVTAVGRMRDIASLSDIEKGMDANELDMEAAAKALVDNLRPQLNFYRGTVKVDVMRFLELVEAAKNEATSESPDFYYEIVRQVVPSWLADGAVGDLLSKNTAAVGAMQTKIDFGPRTVDEIRSMLVIGDRSVDTSTESWRLSLTDMELSAIWLGVFANGANSGAGLSLEAIGTIEHAVGRVSAAMVVGLIARFLMLNPTGDTKVSLAYLSKHCDHLQSWAYDQVGRAGRMVERDLKANRVIISVNDRVKAGCNQIHVYDITYDEFLKNGGTPEQVLGSALEKTRYVFAADISANGKALAQTWERYANVREQAFRENIEARIRSKVLAAWMGFGLCDEGKVASQAQRGVEFQRDCKAAIDYIDHGAWAKDCKPIEVATYLVAGCAYDFTSAYTLFKNMLELADQNPDMAQSEVYYLATLNYIADYFSLHFVKA